MLLSLPPQTAPEPGSFPQERDSVRIWLGRLSPAARPEDATELLRGLRHSNRLKNDVASRRTVHEEFRPALNSLIDALKQSVAPQPLPMTASFRHASALLDELLREEANTWKILLSHSGEPQLTDANNAMTALYRLAYAAAQQYREIPLHCIRDANQIYALAERKELLSPPVGAREASEHIVNALVDSYVGIMTLAVLDLRQIRARQLDLTLSFLSDHYSKVRPKTNAPTGVWRNTQCVLHLNKNEKPVPASSYLGELPNPMVRWFDFSQIMEAVDTRLAKTRTTLSTTLGADTLERQTLNRINFEFSANRTRKAARCISYKSVSLSFGHQQISNQLLRDIIDHRLIDEDSLVVEWNRMNYSTQGAAFRSIEPDIGTVQVGELVAVVEDDGSSTLGVIRWVHALDDGSIQFGMEYLSNEVVPVELSRDNADEGVTDEALIIACRINGKVTQTILLPGYRFHTGDRLTASQVEKRKQIKLGHCLQSNGMFSQFVISDG